MVSRVSKKYLDTSIDQTIFLPVVSFGFVSFHYFVSFRFFWCSIHALEDGTVYKGSFVNMYRHGEGELTFPNGDAYKGTFEVLIRINKAGKFHITEIFLIFSMTKYLARASMLGLVRGHLQVSVCACMRDLW